jgi:hypothetical protein
MNETEFLQACRDLRVLGWVWFGGMVAAGSLALSFAALYQFGVRFRVPRMRSTMKRLAAERSKEKAGRLAAEEQVENLKYRMETIGREAQREITRLDTIRKKTEAALIERNAELANEKDLTGSLQAFLAAVNSQTVEPGSPDSWVPPGSP